MKRKKTPLIAEKKITRKWRLIDAKTETFGRIASKAACYLIGKNKAVYATHQDVGDFVVMINVAEIKVTGEKLRDKKYYRHSWRPGNLKTTTLAECLEKDPKKLMYNAVRLMLPKNKLQKGRLKRLKLFSDEKHTFSKDLVSKVNS